MKPSWVFTNEMIKQSPSIKSGMTEQEETLHRHHTAQLIRSMSNELRNSMKRPSCLATNTALVFMHRFYMYHSFQKYPPRSMAPCIIFLAAKVEETPIKLEWIVRTLWMVIDPQRMQKEGSKESRKGPPPDWYEKRVKELITNENLLLQTLGFDLVVDHPHQSVVIGGDLVGALKKTTQLAYELATNSLHFTTMCLKYKPTLVACTCLNVAFKADSLEIGKSTDGKEWWEYVDPELDYKTITEVTEEFVASIKKNKASFQKYMPKFKDQMQ